MRKDGSQSNQNVFEVAKEFEKQYPGIVEAMELINIPIEKYELALSNLYKPRTLTSNSTSDLNAHLE